MSIPVVSLFCGCGGLDLGFTQEHFETILALDINPTAVKTYNLNHGEGIAQVANLAEVDGDGIITLLDNRGNIAPRGVIGGAPCQTFSKGNVYVKSDDIRHKLPERFAFILKTLNNEYDLDFFVFENVKGITASKHRATFAAFKGQFEGAGFNIVECLLDAQDFQVPQKRPRVFVVGFNKEKYEGWNFGPPHPNCKDLRTVADAIKYVPEPVYFKRGLEPDAIPYHSNHWTMQPKSKKFDNGYLVEGQNIGRSFRVLSWDSPSWTVAYGHREIHIHPSGKRRLSVYEAMLLQGFPKTYRLLGNLSEQVQQVSDAVPPPLAAALAKSVRLFLDGDNRATQPIQLPLSQGMIEARPTSSSLN